jgi:hypothetical protein
MKKAADTIISSAAGVSEFIGTLIFTRRGFFSVSAIGMPASLELR